MDLAPPATPGYAASLSNGSGQIITQTLAYKDLRIKFYLRSSILPMYKGGGQLFLMNHLTVRDGDTVLELGTGCGNLALVAAKKAKRVIAVDSDPSALSLAQANADANRLGSRIRLVRGDLFNAIGRRKFDLCVTNPPFVPMPKGCRGINHSYGGPDGLQYLIRVLEAAPKHIRKGGRLQMLALSVGTHDQPLLLKHVERFSLARNARINLVRLYERPLPLRSFVRAYQGVAGWSQWKDYVLSRGTHLHYFVVNATCDQTPRISWLEVRPAERRRYWLRWEHWKERFVWKPQ